MSMRNYAVDEYGLLMTKEMMKAIASKYCNDYTEQKYENDEYGFNNDLYEVGIVDYISEFTGESFEVDDSGRTTMSKSETYDNDIIYYIPARNYSTLFKPAYENMDELVSEFRWNLCGYLPDDFDYRKHIRHIVGTYYG